MSLGISFVYVYPDNTFEPYLKKYTDYLAQNIEYVQIMVLNRENINIVIVPNDCENIQKYLDEQTPENYTDVIGVIVVPSSFSTESYVNTYLENHVKNCKEKVKEIFLLVIVRENEYDYLVNNMKELLENICF